MPNETSSEIILLLTSTSPGSQDSSSYFSKGLQETSDFLKEWDHQQVLDLIEKTVTSEKELFEFLGDTTFHAEVSILHIASSSLDFDAPQSYIEFSSLIGKFKQLRLVFLHGHVNEQLLTIFLARDIPGIIVVPPDAEAGSRQNGVEEFYERFLAGASIISAFQTILAGDGQSFFPFPVVYDLEANSFSWQGKGAATSLPGLYYLTDNRDRLDWKLPQASLPLSRKTKKTKEPSEPSSSFSGWKMLLSFLGFAVVVVLVLGGLWKMGLLDAKSDCPVKFSSAKSLKTLVLPIPDIDNCELNGIMFSDAIFSTLENFKTLAIPLESYLPAEIKCPLDSNSVNNLVRFCAADLVFWGHFKEKNQDSLNLFLSHGYRVMKRDSQQLLTQSHLISFKKSELTSLRSHPVLKSTVQLVTGNCLYAAGEYQFAIRALSMISPDMDQMQPEVLMTRANAYYHLQQHDQSRQHFDQLLDLQPRNPMAYNGRGMVYAGMGKVDEAISDFDRAILHQPDYSAAFYNRGLLNYRKDSLHLALEDFQQALYYNPNNSRPNGIIAAIYAAEEDDERFYQNLEQYLNNGFTVDSLVEFTPVSKYRDDAMFQEILSRYQ